MRAKTPIPHAIDLSKFVRTDKPHISNSYLSTLKRALVGEPQWFGTEAHLTFGTEHHVRSLQPKEATTRLDKNDDLCTNMSYSFRNNKQVKEILRGAKTEVEHHKYYRGALVLLYVDIEKPLRGWDLKGTSCDNERQFLKKSREYDYFRQAALYQAVCGFKEFTFIGERKEPEPCDKGYPGSYLCNGIYQYHPLFFLPVMDYPVYLQEGKEELHLLIDTHLQLRKFYERKAA